MKYRMNFKWKRLKVVPNVLVALWVALFASFMFCTVKAAISAPLWLNNTKNETITVIDASLFDSRDIRGSRFKLTIKSNDNTFYLWYPVDSFSRHKDTIEKNLLTGSVTQVSVIYLSNSSIQDMVTGHCKIVDLRSDDIVFYHLDEEISRCRHSKSTYLVLSVVLLLVLIFESVMVVVILGIVSFSPVRGAKKKK